ncbi:MAG: hypothetical protein KKG33_04005 [candidate division Zixibacteria bacterium]|nr:hypothetical protein [candidate division Zixibacteria bacterium]
MEQKKKLAIAGGKASLLSVVATVLRVIFPETFGDAKEWPKMIKWLWNNSEWTIPVLFIGVFVVTYFWDNMKAMLKKRKKPKDTTIGKAVEIEHCEPNPDYGVTDAIHDILKQIDSDHFKKLMGLRDSDELGDLQQIINVLQESALRGEIRVWAQTSEQELPTLLSKNIFSTYGFLLNPDGSCRMICHLQKGYLGDSSVWYAPMFLRREIEKLFGLPPASASETGK